MLNYLFLHERIKKNEIIFKKKGRIKINEPIRKKERIKKKNRIKGKEWIKEKEWNKRKERIKKKKWIKKNRRIKKIERIKKNECIKKRIILWLLVIGRNLSHGSQKTKIVDGAVHFIYYSIFYTLHDRYSMKSIYL